MGPNLTGVVDRLVMDHWAKRISPEMAWKQYLENTMVNGAWR